MTMTPDDDADILAALEKQFDEPAPDPEGVNLTELSDIALRDLFDDTREKLLAMGEMLSDLQNAFGTKDSTPEARDLHSIRAACLIEMSKRGMR